MQRVELNFENRKTATVHQVQRYLAAIHVFKTKEETIVAPLNKIIEGHPNIKYLETVRFERWSSGMWHQGLSTFIFDYWNPQFRTTTQFSNGNTRRYLFDHFKDNDLDFDLPCPYDGDANGKKRCTYGTPWRKYFQSYTVTGFVLSNQFYVMHSPFEDELSDLKAYELKRATPNRSGNPRITVSRKLDD